MTSIQNTIILSGSEQRIERMQRFHPSSLPSLSPTPSTSSSPILAQPRLRSCLSPDPGGEESGVDGFKSNVKTVPLRSDDRREEKFSPPEAAFPDCVQLKIVFSNFYTLLDGSIWCKC
ncbi:hypothetical protein GYMLUDRAFT_252172 [Collybiopsis luxurians FD-317 M1]|uniref:Uncharacterized protein n=1 Tax=Collybiopsis luxurians FD-317 M1 TaxID=944289 RepID=A0A0D0C942_9AGAR|nr:hypothetical protein GYMLUDRAFT_252172 [Collybiopsis luxurians FD-317 M1]